MGCKTGCADVMAAITYLRKLLTSRDIDETLDSISEESDLEEES